MCEGNKVSEFLFTGDFRTYFSSLLLLKDSVIFRRIYLMHYCNISEICDENFLEEFIKGK